MNRLNRLNPSILFTCTLASLFGACSSGEKQEFALTERQGRETIARIETTQGEFAIRFFPEAAPHHVENFLQLCGSGFYEGTYFHRVSPGFMIQGGDPGTRDDDLSNDGKGGYTYLGPGTALRPEFSQLPHRRGAVSMAHTGNPDTAGSQFFVLLADAPSFDEKYTVFAEVVEGIEVIEKISEEPGTQIPVLGGFNPKDRQYIERCWLDERQIGNVGPVRSETGRSAPRSLKNPVDGGP